MAYNWSSKIGLRYHINGYQIRVKEVRFNRKYIVEDETGKVMRLSNDQLSQYQVIPPTGMMSLFEVKIDGGRKDVICTLHRAIDLDKGITIPYIAARVNIINMFAAPLENDIKMIPIGLCMSNMTCPNNVNFNVMLENNGIIRQHTVCVYMNDTLSEMLRYVNTIGYDNIIHRTRVHFDPDGVRNIGDTLYAFLDNNGWMDEFNNAFNILNLGMESYNIQDNESGFTMNQIQRRIEREIGYSVNIHSIIKYNEYMDMSTVLNKVNDFISIRANNYVKDIHILSYTRGDRLLVIRKDQKQYACELLDRLSKV